MLHFGLLNKSRSAIRQILLYHLPSSTFIDMLVKLAWYCRQELENTLIRLKPLNKYNGSQLCSVPGCRQIRNYSAYQSQKAVPQSTYLSLPEVGECLEPGNVSAIECK